MTRYDLYQNIGSPKMSNEDDYLNMLKAMVDKYPTAPGGNKAYGLSAWTDWGLWPFTIMYPYMYGYTTFINNQFIAPDYSITSSFLDTNSIFWQGIKFFFKANQLGVLDPECLTQGWDQYAAKIADGELYSQCSDWNGADLTVNGPNAGFYLLPGAFPAAQNVYPSENTLGYLFGRCNGISSSCKYPARAMDLLNFLNSDDGNRLVNSGVKGTDWDVVNGVPQLIGQMASGDATYATTAGPFDYMQWLTTGTWTAADGYPTDLHKTAQAYMNRLAKDVPAQNFVKAYAGTDTSIQYPGQVYDSWVKTSTLSSAFNFPNFTAYMPAMPDNTATVESQASDYMLQNLPSVIFATDQAAYDAAQASIVSALKGMGLEAAEKPIFDGYNQIKDQAIAAMNSGN